MEDGGTGGLAALQRRLAARTPVRADRSGLIEAAVALVLAPAGDDPSVLLIKRTDHPEDPWSGQMALPGGRREASDHDLLNTAVRETREETSIDLSVGTLLGELDDHAPMIRYLPPVVVAPFVFTLPEPPEVVPSEEVALHLWVPLRELPSARVREPLTIRGLHLEVDGYRLGPHLVWGMTERILTPFLELAGIA